jgi:hypothetical protein
MHWVRLESTIPVSERAKTVHALDRAALWSANYFLYRPHIKNNAVSNYANNHTLKIIQPLCTVVQRTCYPPWANEVFLGLPQAYEHCAVADTCKTDVPSHWLAVSAQYVPPSSKRKVKLTLCLIMHRAPKIHGGRAAFIFKPVAKWPWVVSFTPRHWTLPGEP